MIHFLAAQLTLTVTYMQLKQYETGKAVYVCMYVSVYVCMGQTGLISLGRQPV